MSLLTNRAALSNMSEALPTKKCSKCGEVKSLLHFHKHKQSKDGHKSRCKVCNIAESKAYVEQNRELVRAKDKLRGKKANYSAEEWAEINRVKYEKACEYFKANPEKLEHKRAGCRKASFSEEEWNNILEYRRGWASANADKKLTVNQTWRESNPKKYSAHSAVSYALRQGVLEKMPCEVCESLHVHAHHSDYDKPLEVMWLCPEHHAAWHLKHGEGLNGT